MARKPKLLEAKFEQVLLYLDAPQVVLLSSVAGSKVVAVAIEKYKDFEYPFFAAQVSPSQFFDYMDEKFDLRYLLLKPSFKRNFVFDLGAMDDEIVTLQKEKITSSNIEDYLPDPGLFAREHTDALRAEAMGTPQAEQTFAVDGSWDLPEFSYFYSNVTDLYAFFNSIDLFLDEEATIDKKSQITNAFVKPFQGGGSYVSLYGSLLDAQSKENRLHVGGISYNSPGYVILRGFEKPFDEIKSLISNFEIKQDKIADEYYNLRGFLSKNKMLKMPASRFNSGTGIAKSISELTKRLADAMDVVDYDAMVIMSGNNILVAAKVLLSIYRRASRLYEFFLEGRVSLDTPTSVA